MLPWVSVVGTELIAGAILCSVFGALNGNILAKPRVAYALARDGLTFSVLGRVHPRWATPHIALVVHALVAVVLVGVLRDFDRLTTYFIVVEWGALLFAVGAVIVLRRRWPDARRPFRTPGYPWTPLVFVLAAGLIVANAIYLAFHDPAQFRNLTVAFLLFALGLPAYLFWRRRASTPG